MPFELIPRLRELRMELPSGVLQLGASYGQELSEFAQNGVRTGIFVEPLPEPFAHLAKTCERVPNYIAVNTVCAETSSVVYPFRAASNGGMSCGYLEQAGDALFIRKDLVAVAPR